MQSLAQQREGSFERWWARTNEAVDSLARKGLKSIIILGAWTLWNHRNRCVFDGDSPNLATALTLAFDDMSLWGIAGARGISYLAGLLPI